MRKLSIPFVLFAILVSAIPSEARVASNPISSVHVSAGSFSPALGQKVSLAFKAGAAGKVAVQVLDRDGVPIRTLAEKRSVKRGPVTIQWDGRDDRGSVVPDEAYSFRIELVGSGGSAVYLPAAEPARMHAISATYYDRRSGALVYTLPEPCRVHLQSGTAALDPATKQRTGPVLKTVVNREPRAAGQIVETWSGMDESGSVYVPDLPDFVAGVLATSLPENSVITTGNREISYVDWAKNRPRQSALPPFKGQHRDHAGLEALEDVSPDLLIEPGAGTRDADGKTWNLAGESLRARVTLNGTSAQGFARLPGGLYVFFDGAQLEKRPLPTVPSDIDIPLPKEAKGRHLLTLNWVTEYGPAAVNSVRLNLTGGR